MSVRDALGVAFGPLRLYWHRSAFQANVFQQARRQFADAANTVRRLEDAATRLRGTDGLFLGQVDPEDWTEHHQMEMVRMARRAYRWSPHAKAAVRNLCKYTGGQGVDLSPEEDDDGLRDALVEWWDGLRRAVRWRQFEKECYLRAFRDGEVIVRPFVRRAGSAVALRFYEPTEIKTPARFLSDPNVNFGIRTDPEDMETAVAYYAVTKSRRLAAREMLEEIPAGEVFHLKLDATQRQLRGITPLLVVFAWIQKYERWMLYREALNRVRAAVVLIRKLLDGTPAQVATDAAARTVRAVDDSDRQKRLEPGTVITANGIDYKMEAPNLQASDARFDGRAMLLNIAAGTGLSEIMISADASNNNFASSMMAEGPAVKEIEDYQEDFAAFFVSIVEYLQEQWQRNGDLPRSLPARWKAEYGPIVSRDRTKETARHAILHQNGVISTQTWQEREGLDPDLERDRLTEEGATAEAEQTRRAEQLRAEAGAPEPAEAA